MRRPMLWMQENFNEILQLLKRDNPQMIWCSEACSRFSKLAPDLDVAGVVGDDAWLV